MIGGNLGARFLNLQKARDLIGQKIGDIERLSFVYETAAWGVEDQPNYLNQLLCVSTKLQALELLAEIHCIEAELGRERIEKWGARTMDIDILFYESQIIQTPQLSIPHHSLHLRRFMLIPLCELVPDFVHPVLKKTIFDLLLECEDDLAVKRVSLKKRVI